MQAEPQVQALQKTIDILKRTSQQQQEMASHSIEELQSQVAQLRKEGAEREEEMAALQREKGRVLRDQQAKVCPCACVWRSCDLLYYVLYQFMKQKEM